MKFMTYCCRHLWPVIQCGTYDGDVMDPDYVFDVQYSADDRWEYHKEFLAVGDINFSLFKDVVVEGMKNAFDTCKPLEEFGVKVVNVKIDSPREYNFRTDWADVEVEVPDDFIRKTIEYVEHNEDRLKIAKDWIEKRWLSYSGWWSPMPTSWDEMKDWYAEGSDLDIIAGGLLGILTKIAEPELYDNMDGSAFPPLTEELYDYVSGRGVDEFYPVYSPNELLRKYGLDGELRIDESKESLKEVREKLDGWVECCLDRLAYEDMFGTDDGRKKAKDSLVKALKEANIKRLREMK